MPFVTMPPDSDEEAITSPPGHIQKVYAERPFSQWWTSLYSAGPRSRCDANLPYWALSIKLWGCSIRTPIENGFASIGMPSWCSISNVSLALCPKASTMVSVSIVSESLTIAPATLLSFILIPVSFVSKRTCPPNDIIVLRRFFTILTRLSVPRWGLAW